MTHSTSLSYINVCSDIFYQPLGILFESDYSKYNMKNFSLPHSWTAWTFKMGCR